MLGILAVSFNLRIGIVAVGPVVDDIRATTGMSSGTAGLLGAVPFVCMGLFAFVGAPIAARLGSVRLIGYALVVILFGTLARAAAPGAALVVLATVPIGVGIALAQLALPGVVKLHFSGSPGAVTGSYVASLALGAGLGALLMVPLAHALGGWRGAFAMSALPALLAVPMWTRVNATFGDGPRPAPVRAASAPARWRPGPQGLRLGVLFGLQSMCFAAVINWVPALYRQVGWSAAHAGLTSAVISLLVAPASLLLPRLSDGRDRRPWVLATAVVMAAAVLALAVVPRSGSWLWVIAFGVGTGSTFALTLTMPLDLRNSQSETEELTGWMLGIGYIMSATAPALVGVGRDLTGHFELPLIVVSALGFGTGIVAMSPLLRPAGRRGRAEGGEILELRG